ncbi:TPA: N-acetyltransferase family protein [Bacillus pseudomycoides]
MLFLFYNCKVRNDFYRKMGYREVGVFEKQGVMDGEHVDVMIMGKFLSVE